MWIFQRLSCTFTACVAATLLHSQIGPPCAALSPAGRWLNWALVGPLFLSMLFQGSTWLTELISTAKYPR